MAVCLDCHRRLKDPVSIKRKRGPTCFAKMMRSTRRASRKTVAEKVDPDQFALPFAAPKGGHPMSHRVDIALAVQNVMTEEEKTALLSHFTTINPHWRGAGVADVLDELANRDAHLAIIEPMHHEHGCEITTPGLFTAAVLATVYINNGAWVDWPQVKELADRVTATMKGDKN